jgi:hypothetical protein
MDDHATLPVLREFKKAFQWKNVGGKPLPALDIEPRPSVTFQLPPPPPDLRLFRDFRARFAQACRECACDQKMFVLDPYHACYSVDLRMDVTEWVISPLNISEYVMMTTASLKVGLFINPWENSMCLHGYESVKNPGFPWMSSLMHFL